MRAESRAAVMRLATTTIALWLSTASAESAQLHIGTCSIENYGEAVLNSSCPIQTAEVEALKSENQRLTEVVNGMLSRLDTMFAADPDWNGFYASTGIVCGVATNPTSWIVSNVGMLGTHATFRDTDNWSKDCRPTVQAAVTADPTAQLVMRIYDPVDSTHMDFSYTFLASDWLAAFQNPDSTANPEPSSVPATLPTSVGNYASHKIWSVGYSDFRIKSQVYTKDSSVQGLCNGGGGAKYTGTGVKSVFAFLNGHGGQAHGVLCSTGLGMYGPSVCTTGSGHDCYLGNTVCPSGASNCLSDAAQRAAISIQIV